MSARSALAWSITALLVSVSPALAEPKPNSHELQAAAGYFQAHESDNGNLNIDLSYGRFMDDPAWEIGLRQGYVGVFREDARDLWVATTIAFVDYHFGVNPGNQFVPFLGAFTGLVWNDEEIDGTAGPEVGVKAYMNESSFLSARYRYEWFFDDIEQGDETSDGNHVVTVGLGYLW